MMKSYNAGPNLGKNIKPLIDHPWFRPICVLVWLFVAGIVQYNADIVDLSERKTYKAVPIKHHPNMNYDFSRDRNS